MEEHVLVVLFPVIFRFQKQDAPVYPGQMVDVFIGQEATGANATNNY